jgi:hypothetical protein
MEDFPVSLKLPLRLMIGDAVPYAVAAALFIGNAGQVHPE